ncbi:MAG TPA: hypothetical protein VGJ09_15825 [Bryobacteraceae bacterium]
MQITSSKEMLYAVALVAGLLAVAFSKRYWRGRIQDWARGEGLKLVTWRGAWFFEGPSKFLRSRNQHVFRVEVQTVDGIRRTAWLQFGTYWGFNWGSPLTKVEWTDDDSI